MTRAGLATVNPMAGVADLVISNGELLVPKTLAAELRQISGVKVAWPRIFENIKIIEQAELDQREKLQKDFEAGKVTKDQLEKELEALAKSVRVLGTYPRYRG